LTRSRARAQNERVRITMIKKRLAGGRICEKCEQAEQLLRSRGLWSRIDEVAWAVEGEPDSPGMLLAKRHAIEVAPFFVVTGDDGADKVYSSALRLIRELFPEKSGAVRTEAVRPEELEQLASRMADSAPQAILRWGLERYGALCGIAFSGAEDVVLVDMAARTELPFSVFCLDTGRLHPETYRFIDQVRRHYRIEIQIQSPDAAQLEEFVRRKGLFSFYEDGHKECCTIRKVAPLRRALAGFNAWVAGVRRDQSPATRSEIPVIQEDPGFKGAAGRLIKLNPLANWSSAQVWRYIRENGVPHNELHARGFISIGCEPCTRPTHPGEHERAGRWWWEEETQRECGLHVGGSNTEGDGI
jgi:phosphoadenosine phosphosulfate reductase